MKIYKTINEFRIENEKCQELLKDYPVNNNMEAMAVKVLITENVKVWSIPGWLDFTEEQLSGADFDGDTVLIILGSYDEFDELSALITKIRKDIGLED